MCRTPSIDETIPLFKPILRRQPNVAASMRVHLSTLHSRNATLTEARQYIRDVRPDISPVLLFSYLLIYQRGVEPRLVVEIHD